MLGCLLKLPNFVVQKAAAPTNGVEIHQKSIVAIIQSLATSYIDLLHATISMDIHNVHSTIYARTKPHVSTTQKNALPIIRRLSPHLMLQIKSKHEVKEATLHQTVFINAFCIDEGGKHEKSYRERMQTV